MEQLTNEFRVGVPIERAYEVLTDVERIAPCLPGAQLQEIEGEEYRGVVKVKVGPITANYKGAATFLERQPPGKLVLRAEGRETRGQGNANATITVTLAPDGNGTVVSVVTDLTVTGKVAQFGRGVLGDVSAKLLGQFVECLESKVLGGADGAPGPVEALSDAPSAPAPTDAAEVPAAETTAGDTPPASPVEAPVVADEAAVTNGATTPPVVEAEPPDGEAADPLPAGAAVASSPTIRRIDSPEPKPVDLLATAGNPVAKRAAPVVAGIAFLWLLRLLLRRRRR